MIPIDPLSIVTVYSRPPFFSFNFWAWPLMYMLAFAGIFAVPAMYLDCDFNDLFISTMIGMNFGVMLGIVSTITPFYILIFTLIPLFLYMFNG